MLKIKIKKQSTGLAHFARKSAFQFSRAGHVRSDSVPRLSFRQDGQVDFRTNYIQTSKLREYISWQRLFASATLCLLIILSAAQSLSAQNVTSGYDSDQPIQRGMIVRLKKDDATKVEPVNKENAEHIHGVVVSANDAPLSIAVDGQKVFVSKTGRYDVLVSSQNGAISQGDYIAVSAFAGIGMRAGDTEPYIIGRALANFNDSTDVVSTSQVKDSTGANRDIKIGRISLDIGVAKNPLLKGSKADLPEFLQKAATTVAGKPVNAVRVYIGILILAITTVVAGSLLYGGVRSALISIGRNPLSRKSIIRSMFQVIITGLIVFITGVFGVYLILRL
ncbi:MAG: hypothetical protein V4702_02145 [Patescibacteria group bacterium]